MLVRRLNDVLGTQREVITPDWTSRRLLLASEGMGFSLHDTIVEAGHCLEIEYRNHLEAVYCIEGEGSVQAVGSDTVHLIVPGTLYALDKHDAHSLSAKTRLRLVSVFNPPLTGLEVHDETGSYPLVELGDKHTQPLPTSEVETLKLSSPHQGGDIRRCMETASVDELSGETHGNASSTYPSRLVSEPPIIPREEPVVYGGKGTIPSLLSAQDLSTYRTDGYLTLRGLISPDRVSSLRDEAHALRVSPLEGQPRVFERGSSDVRSVFGVHTLNPLFNLLSRDARILEMAEHLLGSQVYIHQSRVNFKQGLGGDGFQWHSDFETWHTEDGMPKMRAFSLALALTDAHSQNGPLMVVPGSHLHFLASKANITPEDNYKSSLRRQEYGLPPRSSLRERMEARNVESVLLKAGDTVIFDCNLLHGSASNLSPDPRVQVFYVYNSVENRLGPGYNGLPSRPPWLAERERVEALTPAPRLA